MKLFGGRCRCPRPHIIVNGGDKKLFPDKLWFLEFDIFGFYFGIERSDQK